MMCIILLLISLTSCVCGTFVVNVTQTSYQAEENHNITLEWMFTTKTGSSLHSLYIYCELLTGLRPSVLFHLHGGVEVPESQDEQFTGRVQCDKDVLREGRLRLHVSRLRTDDSGLYMCEVLTRYGSSTATCGLNVTAAADEPRPQRPTESPQPESWKMFVLYVGLTAVALLNLCVGLCVAKFRKCREKRPLSHTEVHVMDTLSTDCNQNDTFYDAREFSIKFPVQRTEPGLCGLVPEEPPSDQRGENQRAGGGFPQAQTPPQQTGLDQSHNSTVQERPEQTLPAEAALDLGAVCSSL